MTEEGKKKTEELLKCCRKQSTTYDKEKQDWEELGKVEEEEKHQKEMAEKAKGPSGEQQPEAGGSGEKASILKIKSSKGKEVVVTQVREEKQPESTIEKDLEEKAKDESVPGG